MSFKKIGFAVIIILVLSIFLVGAFGDLPSLTGSKEYYEKDGVKTLCPEYHFGYYNPALPKIRISGCK